MCLFEKQISVPGECSVAGVSNFFYYGVRKGEALIEM